MPPGAQPASHPWSCWADRSLPGQLARLLIDEAVEDRIPVTQRTLAAMLGVHRPSLNRVLKQFEGEGLLSLGYGRIQIRSRAGLEQFAISIDDRAGRRESSTRSRGRLYESPLIESSLMEYRVDELATRSGVSVDTVRFYQSRGLLPPPTRTGRIARYSNEHLERLRRVRDLKEKGLTLATIKLLLDGELDAADQALVAALAGPVPGEDANGHAGETFTLDEFAERIGVSRALVLAVEREGLLMPRTDEGKARYTQADIQAARAGLALLEAGLPLADLLSLAREYDRSARRTAQQAVELFDTYVRGPIRASSGSEQEAAERLVGTFRTLLPATTALVAHHFRRVLLAAAQARIERLGASGEIEADLEPSWQG